jgi:hypothetical protein
MAQPKHMPQPARGIGRGLIGGAAVVIASLAPLAMPMAAADLDYVTQRAAMVRTITTYANETRSATGHEGIALRVLEVMGLVPRH